MPATAASVHTSAAPSASFLARRPVWQVSYLAGLAASVAVEAWGLAARAIGVPMRAAGLGLDQAHPRRRAPDRRRGHHSGGREAAIAAAWARPKRHRCVSGCLPSGHGARRIRWYRFELFDTCSSWRCLV
jgi:hypothetical protein